MATKTQRVAARHDAAVERWCAQLERIKEQLYRGFLHQAIWTELRDEIVLRRPHADATFLVSYSAGYVAGQLLLIRRLADTEDQSHSLARLIERIKAEPDVLTRARFVAAWSEMSSHDPFEIRAGARSWHRSFADPADPERLNLDMLRGDLDRLKRELGHIVTWATKTIAHLNPTEPARVPTYQEIRDALGLLAEVTGRYESLLTQSETAEWTPLIQGDWQAVFRPTLFPLTPNPYGWPSPGGFT